LARPAQVESVNPVSLGSVWTMFRRIGALVGNEDRADAVVSGFEAVAREIDRRRRLAGAGEAASAPLRVLLLGRVGTPFCSGHWTPEIIQLAGGMEVLGRAGEKSRRVTWDEVARCTADMMLVAPCGFSLERAGADVESLAGRTAWRTLPAVQNGRVT